MLKRYYTLSTETIIFFLGYFFIFGFFSGQDTHYNEQIKCICCFWSIANALTTGIPHSNLIPIPKILLVFFRLVMDTIFIILPLNICNLLIESSIDWSGQIGGQPYNSINTFFLSSLCQLVLITLISNLPEKLPIQTQQGLLIPFGLPIIIFSISYSSGVLSCLIIFYLILYLPLFFRRNG